MKIFTLTLSPAFDIHCCVSRFLPHSENLVVVTEREAGGKGVNVSRALAKNGIDSLALVAMGSENAQDFCRMLDADGVPYKALLVPGRIRENITIHEENAPETRISFSSEGLDVAVLNAMEQVLSELVDGDACVTMTGRIPDGIAMPEVKKLLHRLTEKGARLVIDSRSFSLGDLLEVRPWLIKPNREEISWYLECEISSFDEVLHSAVMLCEKGIANVMISLGEQGALLVCDKGRFVATPPTIPVASTVGAGDSSIAGFLAATSEGGSPDRALCRAVAFGSAACLLAGTRPPNPADVARMEKSVVLKSV